MKHFINANKYRYGDGAILRGYNRNIFKLFGSVPTENIQRNESRSCTVVNSLFLLASPYVLKYLKEEGRHCKFL